MDNEELTLNEDIKKDKNVGNGLGVAGFILGLIGTLSCCCYGGVLGFPGIVLSALQIRKKPDGFSIAGLVLSIIAAVTFIFLMIWAIILAMNPELYNELMVQLTSTTTNSNI